MDALYTRLHWAAHRTGSTALGALLAEFGEFFVDYAWAEPGDHVPTPRLVRAVDALLRLEAAGAWWEAESGRCHLSVALGELRAWAARLD